MPPSHSDFAISSPSQSASARHSFLNFASLVSQHPLYQLSLPTQHAHNVFHAPMKC
ncbi:Uncharacterised protein [Vibrio cholerae]|nr:Uncharacterised protein [Vibrio cholerae]